MNLNQEKQDAIKIISDSAKAYKNNLEGLNLLFVYRDRSTNKITYFETLFRANNFQHLTGVELIDLKGKVKRNANDFYQKCLNNRLKTSEIKFKEDGTTALKLKALPHIVNITECSKMTGLYNGSGFTLAVDQVVGSIYFCLGLKRKGNYYLPSSCLLEDIRNIAEVPSQILAVLSKSAKDKDALYKKIRYEAKGFKLVNAKLPDELKKIISIEWSL